MSMYRTAEVLKEEGLDSTVLFLSGCGGIDRSRDTLIQSFMQSDSTHFMQIDSDIGWNAEDIVKLVQHDKDFISGVYCVKEDKPRFMVRFNGKAEKGLLGVTGSPGGFCLIKRSTIEKMIDAYPELKTKDFHYLHCHHIFDGMAFGEDHGFCKRADDIGIEMWIDPTIRLRHWGGNKCYAFALEDHVVRRKEKKT